MVAVVKAAVVVVAVVRAVDVGWAGVEATSAVTVAVKVMAAAPASSRLLDAVTTRWPRHSYPCTQIPFVWA